MSGVVGTSSSKSKAIGVVRDTAKAWCSFDMVDTHDNRTSFNVSSVADQSAGETRITFIKEMQIANNYCVFGSAIGNSAQPIYSIATTSGAQNFAAYIEMKMAGVWPTGRNAPAITEWQDVNYGSLVVFGD